MNNKVFALFSVLLTLVIFSTLPIFNYLNDQWRVLKKDYNYYYKGIEPNKSFLKTKYMIENKNLYSSIVMGSSRIGNVNALKFDKNAYNMTYSFGHINTHIKNLSLLLENGVKINKILLGIDDYYIFKNPKDFKTDFLRKPLYNDFLGMIDFYNFYIFKKPAQRDYDIFLNKYQLIKSEHITNPNNMLNRINRENSIKESISIHKEKKLNKPTLLGYKENFRTDTVLNEINQFKNICTKNNIQLTVFFQPMYYLTYIMYNQKEIEKFKRKLVNITPYYDFYQLDKYTLNSSKWFDTSHYVPSIGDEILEKIINKDNLVTITNIDNHLYSIRSKNKNILYSNNEYIIKFNNNFNLENFKLLLDFSKISSNYNDRFSLLNDVDRDFSSINRPFTNISNQIKSNNVIFSFEIKSSVNTKLNLFYNNFQTSKFNKKRPYEVTLKEGNNKFNLLIPSKYINSDLKFNLSSPVGEYKIEYFKIYDQ